MLISLPEFTTAVQALLASKEQALSTSAAAAGEHLCFIGSGREEEDQYVHMVVAHFLQRHLAFVSVVAGGYAGTCQLMSAMLVETLQQVLHKVIWEELIAIPHGEECTPPLRVLAVHVQCRQVQLLSHRYAMSIPL